MKTIKKQVSTYLQSSKQVFLLGINQHGEKVWLLEPSWDCDWYWGFGYISTFNYGGKRDPKACTDISSHSHWDSSVVGSKMGKNNDYCHNPFDSKLFQAVTFTSKEGWELGELFERFYALKKSAEMFGRGGCGVSGSSDYMKRDERVKEINEVIIPEVTKRIMDILTPSESEN